MLSVDLPPDPGLAGMLQGSEPDTKSHGSTSEGCSGASGLLSDLSVAAPLPASCPFLLAC